MAALPASLAGVRTEAVTALQSALGALCTEADDKFFDLSQNAPADEQSLYFDAMRELRVKRQAIIDDTVQAFDVDFVALQVPPKAAAKAAALTMDSLSLLGDDELDMSVAFQGMVTRFRDVLATPLEHLRQRFGKELKREIDVETLPFHPARICGYFRDATDKVAIPLKAKLILYKFFERTVLEELLDVIAQANLALAQAGVLPEIKSPKPRPVPSRVHEGAAKAGKKKKKARSNDDDDDEEEQGGVEVDSTAMTQLLAFARQAMSARGGFALPAGGGGVAGAPGQMPAMALTEVPAGHLPVMQGGQLMYGGAVVRSDVPVQVIASAELTELLTRLQQLQPTVGAGRVLEHAEIVDVQGGLSELMEDVAERPRALNSADDDVINLVSMLFDFILSDSELSSEMKALIGRLQIPLLKVALLDKTLFGSDDHPARRLVNSLAKAGVGWTRDTDDGLYARVEQVVFTVLNEFVDDVDLFARLGDDFDEFIGVREKRMTLIEGRLRDREEGQARTGQAQREVQQVVASRMAGRALPPEVVALVQDAWQRVLYMVAIREGIDSGAWQLRVKVLEVLVWCAQQHEKPEAAEKQRMLVPRLLVSLRKGMVEAGADAARGEELLTALQRVLQQFIAGSATHTVRVVAEVATAEQKPAGAAADSVQVLRRSDSEVVISAAPPEPPPAGAAVGVDVRWLETAENLAPGSWVEFSDPDFKVRAKIAARIKAQNKFIFVNGRGSKIAEKTVEQLAGDFASGVARLVSEAALFDRALESMIARLKTD